MSTYKELCQDVARECGTFSGVVPTAVTGQNGRLLKVVNWTADAWVMIQNLHASWKWMRQEFPVANTVTISGTARYTPASWSITDLAEWINEDGLITIYKSATGVSDEGELDPISWAEYRYLYGRGTQTNNRPIHWSVSPDDNEFCLGPIPDAVYVINGEYRQAPQVLAANGDEPNMPSRFHKGITWQGVMILGEHDEAEQQAVVNAERKYDDFLFALERDQLPRFEIGADAIGSEPLA